MENIGKAIAIAREAKGLTQSDLARLMDISPQAVQKWESGGSGPKRKRWDQLSAILGIGPDGKPLGIVDIYINSSGTMVAIPSYTVPVFEAVASMGLGKPQPDADTVVDNIRLTKTWVDSHLPSISAPSNLAVLSAYGDSMHPTFSDGDLLLVDRGVSEIRLDAVYVLALNQELYVKRIQRRITDGAVIIKSDNPLYDPVVVSNGEREGLSVLGRVVWAWNGKKL